MRVPAIAALLATCLVSAQTGAPVRGSAVGQWSPPRIDWPDSRTKSSVLHKVSVAGFPIVLDQTLLEDAQKHLGGVKGSAGDAGDAEAWLCFRGGDANGPWLFWLTSDEINGQAIGGFIWKRIDDTAVVDSRCALLHGIDPIKLELDIHLGMTKANILRFLGAASVLRDQEMFYLHEREKTIQGTPYTISNGIEVTIREGVVVQIAAFEISSS